jgi:hypothetical protein
MTPQKLNKHTKDLNNSKRCKISNFELKRIRIINYIKEDVYKHQQNQRK